MMRRCIRTVSTSVTPTVTPAVAPAVTPAVTSSVITSVTITDPLVKYKALVTAGVYCPDVAQHRLAHFLQKVYARLKDYSPAPDYQTRLRQLSTVLGPARSADVPELAVEKHPIRRNPLFAHFFRETEGDDSLALARVLTSHQAALEMDSPKGLFLSGDVGTGKSMLLNLLADGLPTGRKRRWHFNTFMLHAFSSLEHFRRARTTLHANSHVKEHRHDHDYSLLCLASQMVEQSPILFLDEFQLPDRAANKILSNLLVPFFQLGGVLVASSNRMPEELEKATGTEHAPPPAGGLSAQLLGLGRRRGQMEDGLDSQSTEFAAFLHVLKARCDFWHMEGTRDWRRREMATSSPIAISSDASPSPSPPSKPAKYFLCSDDGQEWEQAVADSHNHTSGAHTAARQWQPASVMVYGRKVVIARQRDGVASWNFDEIVGPLGPADYITLASRFHTFILDRIPVLNLSMRNEARRFITLLDALYESRCRLIMRAQAGPDQLFFPDVAVPSDRPAADPVQVQASDATYSETISEVFQDQTSPFRPNVSSYRDVLDSGHGPDRAIDRPGRVNFTDTSAFTGQDERFAYKRAASRLWELCSLQWHQRGSDWWQPVAKETRHWES